MKEIHGAGMSGKKWLAASRAMAVMAIGLFSLVAVSQEKPAPPVAPPASATPPTPAAPVPAAASPLSVAPAPPVVPTADAKPGEAQSKSAEATKASEAVVEKKDPPKPIAIILPISSKTLGKAAEAVRAGVLAAAEIAGKEKFVPRVYLTDDEAGAISTNYRKAIADNAVAVIAGITRDGASAVARESGLVPTLALNTPGETAYLDANNFFHISLSVELDARLAARAASGDGFRNVAIVHSTTALAKRTQDAFEKEWTRLGGTVAARIGFSGALDDGPKVKAAMEKPDAAKTDMVFIAADMATARFARPFLPQGMPVFATAQTFDPRAGAVENLDLDSVKYLEMPWFAERDHLAVLAYPRPTEPLPTDYERLYALGIDAWRIVYALLNAAKPTTPAEKQKGLPPIDGVTGRITQDGNQFMRGLTLLEMRDGRPQVVKSAE